MKESVEKYKTLKIETIPTDKIVTSNNARVKKVFKKLQDKSFLDRIASYRETYWDHHHSQTW